MHSTKSMHDILHLLHLTAFLERKKETLQSATVYEPIQLEFSKQVS
jgi:hypothetical protein